MYSVEQEGQLGVRSDLDGYKRVGYVEISLRHKSLFRQATIALNACLDKWSFVVMAGTNKVPAHGEYNNNPVNKNIIVHR